MKSSSRILVDFLKKSINKKIHYLQFTYLKEIKIVKKNINFPPNKINVKKRHSMEMTTLVLIDN